MKTILYILGGTAALAVVSFIPIVKIQHDKLDKDGNRQLQNEERISIFRYFSGGWYKSGGRTQFV